MRIILKGAFLAIFSSLFLLQIAVNAQDGTIHDLRNNSSNKNTNKEIEFPEIDGWEKGAIRKYPQAELGYSIAYQSSDGGVVSIYVYNGGLTKIPNGVNDPIIEDEIRRAKNEIFQVGKAGYYDNVKEVKNDTITLGGESGKVKALYSLFNFTARGQDMDSEIYLFGYQNNFIKIRATRPKAKNNSPNEALNSLLKKIDKLFAS